MQYKKVLLILSLFPFSQVSAQNRIGTGAAKELYQLHCANCHGQDLRGGLGSNLIEGNYKEIGDDLSFLEYVKKGNLEKGMPGYEALFDDAEIRSLEIYIIEERQKAEAEGRTVPQDTDGTYSAGGYKYTVETVYEDLDNPWSINFLPDGSFLVTEKAGSLKWIREGTSHEISGLPEVWDNGQSGLMEVAAHPNYTNNGWIYLTLGASPGESDKRAVAMTKVVRGRINEAYKWVDEEVLFEVDIDLQQSGRVHFGSRIVFDKGYLFFGIGDRGAMDMAQDLSKPNGKIHRIFDDGRVPADNPFASNPDAYPTVWSYGHRNPQGLDMDPTTGLLWESEHGPRGGDEINVVEPGLNYGWPVITYGMNYNGKPISGLTEKEGMEQPKHYWTPSIAVCGIDFYEGDLFPDWKGNLLVGGLASKELHRLVIKDNRVVEDQILLKDVGRVRDVASGPDGAIYLVLNGPSKVVRLAPEAMN